MDRKINGLIYKITNKINGNMYVGQTTTTINKRWKSHCNPSQKYCRVLHNAIAKYGKENFNIREALTDKIMTIIRAYEKHN